MATVTAIANGDWKDDAATVWDGGTEPAAGNSVNLASYHVDVTTTTNAITTLDAGSGGYLHVHDGGKVAHTGALSFDSGETLNVEAGSSIEYQGADNGAGYVVMKVGSTLITPDVAANLAYIGGQDATHRPSYALWILGALSEDSVVQGLYLRYGYMFGLYVQGSVRRVVKNVHIEDCSQGIGGTTSAEFSLRNVCVHGCQYGIETSRKITMFNVTMGEDLNGNADPNTNRDLNLYNTGYFLAKNLRLMSSTPVLLSTYVDALSVSNYGYISTDGILTTNGTVGIDKLCHYAGTVLESGTTQVATPNANCDALSPLVIGALGVNPFYAPIPVSGGDTVSLAMAVELNGSQPANSVNLILDPKNLLGAYDISVEATPQSTETTITVSGIVKAGAYTAMLDWCVEVSAYAAGGTVTVKSMTCTIT